MTSPVSARRFVLAVVIATLSIAVFGLLLIGYVARDSRRGLERELELLRASGAPEFPEQFEFPELPPGDDMVAWLTAIESAEPTLRIEDLPACRPSASEPGLSLAQLESECAEAVLDPLRVGALTECETAFLEARSESEKARLGVAARIDSIAPIDWRLLWQKGEGDGAQAWLLWPERGAFEAERVLCHDAARRARRGDATGACLRLRQGLGLVQRLGDSQSGSGFLTWAWLVHTWIYEGLIPAMQVLPPESGLAEFLPQLERLDVQAQLRSGLIRERAQGLRVFRALRDSRGGSAIERLGQALWIDRDLRTYLGILRETLAACEGGVDLARLRDVDRRLERFAGSRLEKYTRPVTLMLCRAPSDYGAAALTLEASLALAGAALTAREQGTLAARAWIDGRKDPYASTPLQARLGPEGILMFWSVGPDGQEGTAEEGGVADDIRVHVRPRER